ncbi:hypothetical protein Tery_3125 [Trichodesmium erythraeum IMS101]|uniref:TauD/TfdA-like domain-containing protein n=1 Tax=Trichodesmium erythraeum (strain IMS101) TaxID=203124 RepID=Q10ZR7_TRIEI|nr:TauD/TfdA family dioxygenase [Trichodesmium erythraeum GBRTRLIN201]
MKLLNIPAAWTAQELLNSPYWNYSFTQEEVAEIEVGINIYQFSENQKFNFKRLKQTFASISEELENGRGIVLLKGFPVHKYSEETVADFYLFLCQQIGLPIRQSNSNFNSPLREKTQFITYIRAESKSSSDGKQSNDNYQLHTDRYDLLNLLCVRQAKVGGENSFASAVNIYNEMIQSHPEIAQELCKGVPWLFDGEDGWINYPIWFIHLDKFTTQLSSTYPILSQLVSGALPLTETHKKGLDLLQIIGNKSKINIKLEPGDWLIVNNHIVYHARSTWEIESGDYDRLLFRVCCSPSNSRELPDTPTFRKMWGNVQGGKPRGGFLPNHKLPPNQAICEPLSKTESYWLDRYLQVRWLGVDKISELSEK